GLPLLCKITKPDQPGRVRTASTDLQEAIEAVFLKFLFIPDFEIEVGLLCDAACGFRKIFGSCNGTRFVNDLSCLVDRFTDEHVSGQGMPVFLILRFQAKDLQLDLTEVALFSFVTVECVTAENGSFDRLADERDRGLGIEHDAYARQSVINRQANSAGDEDFYIFPNVVIRAEAR